MEQYAYGRVSAKDQNLARQIEEFRKFGIPPKNIYTEKQSGKDFDREAYIRLCSVLKENDLLVIKSIDRLGRNYDMIINEWTRITKKIGANIFVLDMPMLDTRERKENLLGKFLSDVVLQVLSFVAQNERENIKARQAEGIAIAKANGVKFGRPINKSENFEEIASAYNKGKITLENALRETKMPKTTFRRHLKNYLIADEIADIDSDFGNI